MWDGGLENRKRRRNSEHWVCFDCRKMFRKPSRYDPSIERPLHKCPECKKPMRNMGVYFEPPRRNEFDAWERLRLLADHHYTCHSEGGKSLVHAFMQECSSARALRERLAAEHLHSEPTLMARRRRIEKRRKS